MEKYLVELDRILVETKEHTLPYKVHVSICKSPDHRCQRKREGPMPELQLASSPN